MIWWIIAIALMSVLGIFSMLKSASDADDRAKVILRKNNTYKN